MRRLVAIVVMLLAGFTLVAPMLDLSSSALVAACCRRNGQHHCMGQMMGIPDAGKTASIVVPKCPLFPVASVIPQAHSFMPHEARNTGIPLFVGPASLPQTEARYRLSYARSRQKRGPPVILHQI